MLNILDNADRRKLEIIERLYDQSLLTYKELSDAMGVSIRILKEDIRLLKEMDELIIETSHAGIQLNLIKQTTLNDLYRKVLTSSTSFSIFQYLLDIKESTIEAISEHVFISVSTFNRLIKRLNIPLETYYNIRIETGPVRLEGDEASIRYFYWQLYTEAYSVYDWPFSSVDETVFDDFVTFFIEMVKMNPTFGHYREIKMIVAVNLMRTKAGHFVHYEANDFKKRMTPFGDIVSYIKKFETDLDMEMTLDTIEQLFVPYVKKDFIIDVARLKRKRNELSVIDDRYAAIKELLDHLITEYEIEPFDYTEVIWALLNFTTQNNPFLTSTYILNDKMQRFSDQLEERYPLFFNDVRESLRRNMLDVESRNKQSFLNRFMFILFTEWNRLIPQLEARQSHVKVLIISSFDVKHSYMIRDVLHSELNAHLSIETYEKMTLDKELFSDNTYDLIIADFSLPVEDDKVIIIDILPTSKDLERIEKRIAEIT